MVGQGERERARAEQVRVPVVSGREPATALGAAESAATRWRQSASEVSQPVEPWRHSTRMVSPAVPVASVEVIPLLRAQGCHEGQAKPATLLYALRRHSADPVFRPASQPDDLKADLLESQSSDFVDEGDEAFKHGHFIRPNDHCRVARFSTERSRQAVIRYGFVV